LKEKLPGTFVDHWGYIRYILYALIDDGKKHFYSVPIQILSPLKENTIPSSDLTRVKRESEVHHVKLTAQVNSWIYFLDGDKKLYLKIVSHSLSSVFLISSFDKQKVENKSSHAVKKISITVLEKRMGKGKGKQKGKQSSNNTFRDKVTIAERILKHPDFVLGK